MAILPPGALRLALDVHGIDFQLQFGDAVANLAPVHLCMRFAGTTAAQPATLPPLRPGELGSFAQTRRHVAETGDLDLRPCGARTRVAVEDFKDDHGAVHHLAADLQLEVARLRRRDFVVDEQDFDGFAVQADGCRHRFVQSAAVAFRLDPVIDEATDFLPLADAEITSLVETRALLNKGADNLEPQGLGKFAQLVDRRFKLVVAHVG